MDESRQKTTDECDIVHLVSHVGDDHLEDDNKGAEEVGRMNDSGGLKGIGMTCFYFNSKVVDCHRHTTVLVPAYLCSKENKVKQIPLLISLKK
jgi:hypothetical protein